MNFMGLPLARTFEELDVYQRAFRVSLEVHRTTLSFPKIEQFALADQLRRASKSICANIAEGFAKQRSSSAADFKRFLLIGMGSCNEVLVWLDYCRALEYVDPDRVNVWKEEYTVIGKMLNRLYSTL